MLFLKKNERIICNIKKDEIDEYNSTKDYCLSICSANLLEALLIPHAQIFRTMLHFISGEYHGFFMYYEKTIEDRFYLNFNFEQDQVRINGKLISLTCIR